MDRRHVYDIGTQYKAGVTISTFQESSTLFFILFPHLAWNQAALCISLKTCKMNVEMLEVSEALFPQDDGPLGVWLNSQIMFPVGRFIDFYWFCLGPLPVYVCVSVLGVIAL